MRRELGSGFELDDDRNRVDVDAVHAFLTSSYWALGRPHEVVARHVAHSARVVGLYEHGSQVGFARIESDDVTFAWLFDVYVLPEHRGRGLGIELARFAVDEGPHRERRWILHTRDAYTLYERLGFGATTERTMERPARVIGPLDMPAAPRMTTICGCQTRSGLVLEGRAGDSRNPLRCLDCGLDAPTDTLAPKRASEVARWHAAHASLQLLALDAGAYATFADAELADPASATNARGRDVAGAIGAWHALASSGERCPGCSARLRAAGGWLLCEACRIAVRSGA